MAISVGYAQAKITPDISKTIYLAGFDRNRQAEAIHDDLWVRVTALKSGKTACKVLISCDLIGLGYLTCQIIRNLINSEVPKASILISCTHTHHGPDTLGLWGPDMFTSGVDEAYLDWVINTVAETALLALERLSPAKVRVAAVNVPDVVKNIRDPLIVDDELIITQFQDLEGEPVVSWINFACHPETLWKSNPLITADYPFFLRQAVEERLGGAAVFFPGALGGMLTPDVNEHSFSEAERIGNKLASRAVLEIVGAEWLDDPIVNMESQTINIPVKSPLLEEAMVNGLISGVNWVDGYVETRVSLLLLGNMVLVGVPGELLPKLGLWIKDFLITQKVATISGIIGLADDEIGYIIPREDFVYPIDPFNPGQHYEETMSIGPDTSERVLEGVRRLVKSFKMVM